MYRPCKDCPLTDCHTCASTHKSTRQTTEYNAVKDRRKAHNKKARRTIVSNRRANRKAAEAEQRRRVAWENTLHTFDVPVIELEPEMPEMLKPSVSPLSLPAHNIINGIVYVIDTVLKNLFCRDLTVQKSLPSHDMKYLERE